MNFHEIKKEAIRDAFTNWRDSEHRLERVGVAFGVCFINDSKATTLNAAWLALEETPGPIIWIVGGVDKGNSWEDLEGVVKAKVRAIVVLGNAAKFHKAFSRDVDLIVRVDCMAGAVEMAQHLAKKGESVLLSPACQACDLFEGYEDRGREFKRQVANYL